MCNFIIRPVTSFATIDIFEENGDKIFEAGEKFEVSKLKGKYVLDKNDKGILLEVYIHTFSLKDPNKKEEKKK